MKADAIVVAYQSSSIIRRCIDGLRSDPSIGRIIVVNNSAGDSTADIADSVKEVVYLETPSNLGYGAAINFARQRVTTPYVVLANPDAIQDFSTISQLLQFIADHPDCAVVGPRLARPDGGLDRNSQHDFDLVRLIFQSIGWPERLQIMRSRDDHLREHQTDCLIGAFVLCRVEALDEIGWFDETIFLFGEDQDLCRRLRRAGWEVWFAPVGRVLHLDGHSWRQLSDEGRTLFREARYRELGKTQGRLRADAYRALVRVRDAALLLRRLGPRRRSSSEGAKASHL